MKNEPDEFLVLVGSRIESAYKTAGMSKEDFVKATGKSRTSINRYLRGAQSIDLVLLKEIARITNKPMYYFISTPGEKKDRPLTLVVDQGGREVVKVETGDSAEIKIRFVR